jgi:predicted secreted protein
VVGACSSGQDGPGTGNSDRTKVVQVGEPTGSTDAEQYDAKAAIGSEVLIELPFQGGTGYSWSMSSHSDGLVLVRMDTTTLKPNLPGGPMKASFTMRVERSGRQTARLELARLWETDSAPARQVEVVIN